LTFLRQESAQDAFVDYFRCATDVATLNTSARLSSANGYFAFQGSYGFGRVSGATASTEVTGGLADLSHAVDQTANGPMLPFDLAEVVTNLREERYRAQGTSLLRRLASTSSEKLYYLLRPMMQVGLRKHLQRLRLRGWQRIPFPRWPVDSTVDDLMRHTMGVLLRTSGADRLPFIWFWPDGAPSCTMLTHDVEGKAGLEFCGQLMDLDDSFGIKASYQLIPEGAEGAWQYAPEIRRRGCEANLHDLNHDGRLYRDRAQFLERARRINDYARAFGCGGFRSGAMYREQSWFAAFDFEYDMSVPNVSHLEPQRGGCCTVMPYFVGDVLELPLTTAQDYSLFFILGDYSTTLWREQIARIRAAHGLVSVITHPDYLTGARERAVYEQLLAHLAALRDDGLTWMALPGQINRWWRDRRQMFLTQVGSAWRVEGPGSERAAVAYASLDGERVVYSFDRVM
jgi:hypothetical protein